MLTSRRRNSAPRLAPVTAFSDAHLGFESHGRRLLYNKAVAGGSHNQLNSHRDFHEQQQQQLQLSLSPHRGVHARAQSPGRAMHSRAAAPSPARDTSFSSRTDQQRSPSPPPPPIPPHEPFSHTRTAAGYVPSLHTHPHRSGDRHSFHRQHHSRRDVEMPPPPPNVQRSSSYRTDAPVKYVDGTCSKDVYV